MVFDCRGCKVLEVRLTNDEDRIVQVETELQATILFGEEADRKYEEVTDARGRADTLCCFRCMINRLSFVDEFLN